MQTFETTDPTLARRCRYAQYRNEKTTLKLSGSPVTGKVHSVMQVTSSLPVRWIVTVIAERGMAA
jgi:hypothetical protein